MSAIWGLDELGRAEFETALASARTWAVKTVANVASARGPGTALNTAAGYYAAVGWWSFWLGNAEQEVRTAWRESMRLYRAAIETFDERGIAIEGWQWINIIEDSILWAEPEVGRWLLARGLDVACLDLHDYLRGYLQALAGLFQGDAEAGAEGARRMARVPEERIIKTGFYPGLAAATLAILEGDAARARSELSSACARHLVLAKRGYLRGSEASFICGPVSCLIQLAHRYGVAADVEPEYHAAALTFRVRNLDRWQDRPVMGTTVRFTADLVPVDWLPSDAQLASASDDARPGPGAT